MQHLLVLLIPLGAVLYPLVRVVPGLYGLGIRYPIFRLYGELKLLDLEAERRGPGEKTADLSAQLDRLEGRASHLHVPVMYAQLLFALRRDIDLVRQHLERGPDAVPGTKGVPVEPESPFCNAMFRMSWVMPAIGPPRRYLHRKGNSCNRPPIG